jgi:hypothetical protein
MGSGDSPRGHSYLCAGLFPTKAVPSSYPIWPLIPIMGSNCYCCSTQRVSHTRSQNPSALFRLPFSHVLSPLRISTAGRLQIALVRRSAPPSRSSGALLPLPRPSSSLCSASPARPPFCSPSPGRRPPLCSASPGHRRRSGPPPLATSSSSAAAIRLSGERPCHVPLDPPPQLVILPVRSWIRLPGRLLLHPPARVVLLIVCRLQAPVVFLLHGMQFPSSTVCLYAMHYPSLPPVPAVAADEQVHNGISFCDILVFIWA